MSLRGTKRSLTKKTFINTVKDCHAALAVTILYSTLEGILAYCKSV